jgi:hypothetical protein
VSNPPVVCDTSVLLYLGRIGQFDLLPAIFASICVPESVVLELDMGRLLRRDTVDPRSLAWATIVSVTQPMIDALPPNRLGTGERDTIAYAQAHHTHTFAVGLDDLQARQVAESIGLTVVGTLGVLVRAKRAGLIPAVEPLVDAVTAEGFRLGSGLYQAVLELAGEI